MIRLASLSLIAALAAAPAFAAPETYTIDGGHANIVFSYDHAGFSSGVGMFSGYTGTVQFDQANPAASSVTVSFPVRSMFTGWQERFDHFMSSDFFDAATDEELVSFTSTAIEVTGEKTAKITGDLTVNGITKPVVLDAVLNSQTDEYPFPPFEGKKAIGFSATTTLLRSDYDVGAYVPYVGDELKVQISFEAMKLD